jgi:hypothetical protein
MSKLEIIVLVSIGVLAGCFMVNADSHATSSLSEELDPADVEEPGCPKITHLKHVNLREVRLILS